MTDDREDDDAMTETESTEPEMTRDEPSPEEVVTISRGELDALRARASAEVHEPVVVATAPAAPDAQAAALAKAYLAAVRDRELATALAGRPLVPGAAAQLIRLWRDDFDAHEVNGEVKVVARDGRAVTKAVVERLAEAEFAHFCPPSSRGGAAAKAANRPGSTAPATPPRNLGDAVLQSWKESATARSDPSSRPIGLRRR